jgi:hypothetical protein
VLILFYIETIIQYFVHGIYFNFVFFIFQFKFMIEFVDFFVNKYKKQISPGKLDCWLIIKHFFIIPFTGDFDPPIKIFFS